MISENLGDPDEMVAVLFDVSFLEFLMTIGDASGISRTVDCLGNLAGDQAEPSL